MMAPNLQGLVEPEITINGQTLNFAQAMTVRVAIESFAMSIAAMSAREREGIFDGYRARIDEIREYIFANQPERVRRT
jgi:hypothetical protein